MKRSRLIEAVTRTCLDGQISRHLGNPACPEYEHYRVTTSARGRPKFTGIDSRLKSQARFCLMLGSLSAADRKVSYSEVRRKVSNSEIRSRVVLNKDTTASGKLVTPSLSPSSNPRNRPYLDYVEGGGSKLFRTSANSVPVCTALHPIRRKSPSFCLPVDNISFGRHIYIKRVS